ncbi:sigma-70 family RNA polymerase sigma factor [Cupriavidus basilensis]|uniref:Sigma-70 family RNA polymerase sigma factor n=1 Tax=Cupriavidus basilensis TaxID=68895 RepID=A0ABT6ATR1_9BURK|nr:sigma-70 family RNA polymerase sigma factor [Cupriavidus basilensis]MDF3835854.1 sigma-70 family RNA polymerase sigma factor [Cupriavidus basilensis]
MDTSIPHCVKAPGTTGDATGAASHADESGVVLRDFLVLNYDQLRRRLTRHVGCSDTACDSLQEAWLRLGSATLPDAVRSAEAYVYRVACNLATDQLRDRRMWPSLADADSVFEHLADHGPGPEAVVEARSDLAALDRALENVPGRHRRVLVGLRLEELTREEVAARHGISLRSVDTVLRQTLDYCATQTGRRAVGGVNTPRRALLHTRKRDCGAYASEKETPTGAYSALVDTAHSLCTVE